MSELYWITRLDAISVMFGITAVITGLALLIILLFYLTNVTDSFMEKECNIAKKCLKYTVPIFVISILFSVFIPTSKDAIMIWGIGGTIDYIKSNDTAKQLPDKCIKALDKWVDEYMTDEKKEE